MGRIIKVSLSIAIGRIEKVSCLYDNNIRRASEIELHLSFLYSFQINRSREDVVCCCRNHNWDCVMAVARFGRKYKTKMRRINYAELNDVDLAILLLRRRYSCSSCLRCSYFW